jgi:UPF0042 nucleotide-binding protein
MSFARFVVVAGLSGAGKSQAMKCLEDLGFYCLDNLPPVLALEFVTLAQKAGIERLALSLDVRTQGPFATALGALADLTERGIPFDLLFLDASDEAIVRRYSETRRRHPLERDGKLGDAITLERRELAPIRARADRVWNTSAFSPSVLKARIVAAYATSAGEHALAVHVVAFGYKFGLPLDADLVFDVRFLSNPNYVDALRPLTGIDRPVAEFMGELPQTGPFLERLFALLDYVLPHYAREGKSRLTIGIGCTGGRHRSVYVAEALAAHLRALPEVAVTVEHREVMPV